jgi:hypothetical protein
MTRTQRILLAAAVLIIDTAVFFLPISALFLAYLIVFDPARLGRLAASINRPPV